MAPPQLRILPSDVGKRVSVQFFEPDGSRREAVGVLERVEHGDEGPVLYIRRRDDSLARVPLRRVRYGKVIPSPRTR